MRGGPWGSHSVVVGPYVSVGGTWSALVQTYPVKRPTNRGFAPLCDLLPFVTQLGTAPWEMGKSPQKSQEVGNWDINWKEVGSSRLLLIRSRKWEGGGCRSRAGGRK